MGAIGQLIQKSARICRAAIGLACLGCDVLLLLGKCPRWELYAEILRWLPGETGVLERRRYFAPSALCARPRLARQREDIVMVESRRGCAGNVDPGSTIGGDRS
jgi:hypothetical protein